MMLTWIISSSVLLAGFLVLRHILTAAMSRRLQYALWAIVLLRLLLPFSFGETGFSVMNVPPVQMLTAGIDSSFDGITSLAPSQQETGLSLSPQPISSPDQITPTRVLFYFWLAGTLVIGAYFAAVNLHFALRLRRSRQAVKCKQARLPVYKTDAIGSTETLSGPYYGGYVWRCIGTIPWSGGQPFYLTGTARLPAMKPPFSAWARKSGPPTGGP